MIASPHRSHRGFRPVRLVVVHTAEGARTAGSLGAYFAKAATAASSHVGIDATTTEQYVPYDMAAWTLRTGNPVSDNAELCAFARWTRAQWLSTETVDGCANPRAILRRTSAWIAERCTARGIPLVKLTPGQVAAGGSGVIGHVDWTLGMRDGTHTDPGGGFPWDVVMDDAIAMARPIPEEDDVITRYVKAKGADGVYCMDFGAAALRYRGPVDPAEWAAVQGAVTLTEISAEHMKTLITYGKKTG